MTQTHQVGIKLLHSDAKIPTKANHSDSCYDVVAVRREALYINNFEEDIENYEQDNTWHSFLRNFFNDSSYRFKRLYDYRLYGYKYHLGFALDLPSNTELQVRARSSIYKTGLILSNGIGTGDEGYTGEYSIIFYHVVPELPPYEVGDRVAQIQVVNRADINFNLVEELPNKDRGVLGWGSSGLKELRPMYRPARDVTYD